jgi:hypothetical protein
VREGGQEGSQFEIPGDDERDAAKHQREMRTMTSMAQEQQRKERKERKKRKSTGTTRCESKGLLSTISMTDISPDAVRCSLVKLRVRNQSKL